MSICGYYCHLDCFDNGLRKMEALHNNIMDISGNNPTRPTIIIGLDSNGGDINWDDNLFESHS